ncbi:MAG: pantetheine-phosphate adenylyltransferase [Pseudomonadota bacterium]
MDHAKRIGVYPGSFDPVTFGHFDIIRRACANVVDYLFVVVAVNTEKNPFFSLKEREKLLHQGILGLGLENQVEIYPLDGLLVDFARAHQAKIIIRGLRAVSDFDYEFQMAGMNNKLEPAIETVFLTASDHCQFISSRMVREIALLRGDISHFADQHVVKAIKQKMQKKEDE